ncbi:arginase [Deinococcus sp. Marseille-Q6407]|uniref:arginase n=1 Tax=Deinococcus sp. Marseille-Q6407 TaxID=2969223 RepID=UPI0021BFBC20|nr:arginase [Deinococcus sp. Marseille-Q6407]
MLLSIDWDAYSGTRELVFDAPIWGTADRDADRLERWRERARKRSQQRGGSGAGWDALADDFPLYPGWEALARYAGLPAFVTLSHADIWPLLERFGPGQEVLNIDSHHDLTSFSGDGIRLRPGNWAGLALGAGLAAHYECRYPLWHAELPVAEGFDLARTRAELEPLLPAEALARVKLTRSAALPDPAEVTALVLVQSPAWTNPAHDREFWELAGTLGAETLVSPLRRA